MNKAGTDMTPKCNPDAANDRDAFKAQTEATKRKNAASLGKSNGAKGGN
ncbi:hypothetical protein OR1_03688 [Geobacter sp. OR-1]|nr:hypothetical protein [Geobacter sp. OR-1]GAM11373.1 hypothetical protein OR1_03688 [Geobacter sp. OR-1]